MIQFRRILLTGVLGAAAAGSAAMAQPQPPGVQVEHAAARVVVIAEPRSDVSVTVSHGPNRLPQLQVRREGGRIVVDGGLAGRRIGCTGGPHTGSLEALFANPSRRDVQYARVEGVGQVDFADLPVITAHVPLDAGVGASGAVWGQIGRARRLSFGLSGCGDWIANDVSGPLNVGLSGSGDLHAGDVGSLHAGVSGSGDLGVRRVANGAEIAVNGSGDVRAQALQGTVSIAAGGSGNVTADSVDGPVSVKVSGSSDVRLRSGRAPNFSAATSGSGDIEFGGQAGRVEAVAAGSGDIRIAHASGPITQVRSGQGEIEIGR